MANTSATFKIMHITFSTVHRYTYLLLADNLQKNEMQISTVLIFTTFVKNRQNLMTTSAKRLQEKSNFLKHQHFQS